MAYGGIDRNAKASASSPLEVGVPMTLSQSSRTPEEIGRLKKAATAMVLAVRVVMLATKVAAWAVTGSVSVLTSLIDSNCQLWRLRCREIAGRKDNHWRYAPMVNRHAQNHSAGWGSGGQAIHSQTMRGSTVRAKLAYSTSPPDRHG